jgi:hypothetical protein
MATVLGWVRDRWAEELEPMLRTATVEQEADVRALWELELEWWKTQRHLRRRSATSKEIRYASPLPRCAT